MQTITLTPAFLAALAEGVTRLEKGDLNMNEQARQVRYSMARDQGLILSQYTWFPASDASSGYVKPGVSASMAFEEGRWWVEGYENSQELAPGQVLYLDSECTIPLRTIE